MCGTKLVQLAGRKVKLFCSDKAERVGELKRMEEITDFLEEQTALINEYDEQLTRRLIEKITVFDDIFEVRFKSGVTINITR